MIKIKRRINGIFIVVFAVVYLAGMFRICREYLRSLDHGSLDLGEVAWNIALVIIILSVSMTTWRLKRHLKKRMGEGLGRTPEDYELTSINAWMRLPEDARAEASREADRYDFN